ncbi:chitin synthase chs-2-like [Ischnura elegans]|uniref:chitin synthase chs-2-like n=1 Tax=Ischnura elegans TaxID=197161 RepID=UPI001ED8AD78|nr:chitin synthase chs-2-like [Ischnura elegans]
MARRASHFAFGQPQNDDDEDEEGSSDEESLLIRDGDDEGSDGKKWDVQIPSEDIETSSSEEPPWIEMSLKIMKTLAYIVVFCVVLLSAVLSKGLLLFMTSQISPGKVTEFCNKDFGIDKHYTSEVPEFEQMAWRWCIMIAFAIPELGTFVRAVRICFFKSWNLPTMAQFRVVFLAETLSAIGYALLLFSVLPNLDVVRGAMITNCVCLIPGILGLLSWSESTDESDDAKEEKSGNLGNKQDLEMTKALMEKQSPLSLKKLREIPPRTWCIYSLYVLAILSQLSACFLWPLTDGSNSWKLWCTPFALLFISITWWENFTTKYSKFAIIRNMSQVKDSLKKTRYFIYSIVSLWKIGVFFSISILIMYADGVNVPNFLYKAGLGFTTHKVNVTEVPSVYTSDSGNIPDIANAIPIGRSVEIDASSTALYYVVCLQVLCAYVCYIFGKFACKICIQPFSFAFPINLTVPVTVTLLIVLCSERSENACAYYGVIPNHLFFNGPSMYLLAEFLSKQHVWIWVLWLLSQAWITFHIWTPKCDRVASTDKLFVVPLYSGVVTDQSLALNRRQDDEPDLINEDLEDYWNVDELNQNMPMQSKDSNKIRSSDRVTRIFACATMWHETREEMIEMLKSIFYLDSDQSARHKAQQYFRIVDPDYYKLEVHIFFDDAFELTDDEYEEKIVNQFVKLLVTTIEEAAHEVHDEKIKIRPPKKYPTPYGGRLVWTLPGKNKLYAHLKDMTKIRKKKRWSQCMYMYYLLGYRLMELPIHKCRKQVRAENTFILALDGDIDFKPKSVQLLVDLMKKNPRLGAACGRIHPVGSGPMVWYQKFEYAVGHWLQKATEHTIGTVLCSPGCFSLFRGTALMEVMSRYTAVSKEARHYVQFDQGEDRWLCTLLLQQGFHVEYSAASDAYTHCPEGFNEFYNQRRRWVPSTMANIMDLLGDFRKTVKLNDSISTLYIGYQMVLMAGSILGPGTIFLMLVGAFNAAFKIDNYTSFYYNLIPILVFMFVCFLCKSDVQLWVALLISTLYALVMVAVLVGIMMQMAEDGPLAPSSLFLFTVAGEFIITAFLHPKEFFCLIHGVTYYITVPSMYLLLIIYSIFNLNNVSWGTREIISNKKKREMEEEKKRREEEAKKSGKKKGLLGVFGSSGGASESGSMEISFAGLFKCMMCTHPDTAKEEEKVQLLQISESLKQVNKRLEAMERMSVVRGMPSVRRMSASGSSIENNLYESPEEEQENQQDEIGSSRDAGSNTTPPKMERDDLVNPFWIEEPGLKNGEVDHIPTEEEHFWKDVIDKYLTPIAETEKEKEKVALDLKQLRDKSVFAFFMLNAFFVVTVFLLQLHQDLLNVKWPLGVKNNITFVEQPSVNEVRIFRDYKKLEPIGLVFVLFFGFILIVQFIAMCIHRLGTFSHLLASTDLNFYFCKTVSTTEQQVVTEAVNMAREAQKLKGANDDMEEDDGGPKKKGKSDFTRRRPTVIRIEDNRIKLARPIDSHDVAFRKRIESINPARLGQSKLGRRFSTRGSTFQSLKTAKQILNEEAERRKSISKSLSKGSTATAHSPTSLKNYPPDFPSPFASRVQNASWGIPGGSISSGSSVRKPMKHLSESEEDSYETSM